ncbi:zinc-ribbon domain-containing protein [Lysinibacillus sp. BW-2-10]|uniref:zinc ribbon domain-containing protein n=1 Tax=Lysinibacillus sp. BW-2-10 TaxID=2590030 RepID=UPI00117FC483|nr:zinc-ribbon domain-containing protein [Lysinibacillus sp. BW-2-10]TSI10099.1 zinc-ribbon domain-containing protein [Lysinibacillus sp. BW-2-10]
MRICNNCGKEATNHEYFCIECGTPFPPSDDTTPELPINEHPIDSISMYSCHQCGKEIKQSQKFCVHCGTPIIEPELEMVTAELVQSAPKRFQKKKFGLATKITGASVLILLIAVITTHLFIAKKVDPEAQIVLMNQYFSQEKKEDFTNLFVFSEDTIYTPATFFNYMENDAWNSFAKEGIERAIQQYKLKGYAEPIYDEAGNKVFTVIEEKFFIFYKKLIFQYHPIEVKAKTTSHSITLKMGEDRKKSISTEAVVVGKFVPGKYNYTIVLKDEHFEKEEKYTLSVVGEEKNEQLLEIDLSAHVTKLTSDIEEAIVYINGKNTNKTVAEIELLAAPLDSSVEIYAEAKENDEIIKSETLQLTKEQQHITFAKIQQQRQAEKEQQEKQLAIQKFYGDYRDLARDTFYNFRNTYNIAVNYADFSYVDHYFIDGSQLQKNYQQFVVDQTGLGYYYYEFISNDILKIEPLSENSIKLTSKEIFNFYSEMDGNWHYEREKQYIFELVNGILKISSIEDVKNVSKTKIN